MLSTVPGGKQERGKSRPSWIDGVLGDVRKLYCRNRRMIVQDRNDDDSLGKPSPPWDTLTLIMLSVLGPVFQ